MDINDTVAVVTGAASGIGRATAIELTRRGSAIVAADLHESRLAEVCAEIEAMGGRALPVRCDVASDRDVERLAAEALREMGHVDIVMNNAGIAAVGVPERMTMEEWDATLQVNLYGVIRGVRAFLPHLLERGTGHVVNVASLAGLFAYSWYDIPYTVAKAGVVGLTESLALYVRPLGVGVSLVCTGPVKTNIAESIRPIGVDDPSEWFRYGEGPPAVVPEVVAERVCDAIVEGTFFVVTAEDHIRERMQQRAADYDGFVDRMSAFLPAPPNLHRR